MAAAALRRGYSVHMFFWGDSVYGVCGPKSSNGISKAVAELSSLYRLSEELRSRRLHELCETSRA